MIKFIKRQIKLHRLYEKYKYLAKEQKTARAWVDALNEIIDNYIRLQNLLGRHYAEMLDDDGSNTPYLVSLKDAVYYRNYWYMLSEAYLGDAAATFFDWAMLKEGCSIPYEEE